MFQQTWMGTHDLSKAKVGDEYGPIEITITEEMVERRLWANDDYNPLYMEDLPSGERIASPIILVLTFGLFFWSYYAFPPGGTLHTKQEFEFLNHLKVGKKVKMTARLVDRYSRRGRDFFTAEFLIVDDDGMEIARMRRTVAAPIIARREE